jgi:hypothetical protein
MKFVPALVFLIAEIVLFSQLLIWDEVAFAQLLLLSQVPVLFLVKPYIFRRESHFSGSISKRTRVSFFLLALLLLCPYVLLVKTESHINSLQTAGLDLFSEGREGLLALGFALATVFVMSVLIQRRGASRWK